MKQGKSYTIYKINSESIKKTKWNFVTDFAKLRKSEEVVGLSESTLIRILRRIEGIDELEFRDNLTTLEAEITDLKSYESSKANLIKLKELNQKLRDMLHIKDLVMITMNKPEHFDRLNSKKGFTIDGVKYKRLFGTAGGVKNKTLFYASDNIYGELVRRIENGRDMEIKIPAAKLEAYKSLVASSSLSVGSLDPKKILVVNDCKTIFKEDVIRIYDEKGKNYPTVEEVEGYTIENNASDGFGLISPKLAEEWGINSGGCMRNAFLKGMIFPFDFHEFAKTEAEEKYEVFDVWSKTAKDIRDVQLILTTSMLKLWKAYKSIEEYIGCCNKNGFTFSITKVTPKSLENQRDLNYQFIQSLELSDADIEELVRPTVDTINDIMSSDYRKTILYLKGEDLKEKGYKIKGNFDYTNALMIEPKLINDPYVKNKVKDLISKRIVDAMKGDLVVRGNFAIASGDPYALCQTIFNMKVTGLLKAGEHYSRYWSDNGVNRVACFRAPMSVANNIRILNFKDTDKMKLWYKHMKTVNIFNAFDTTPHAQNGEDYDSDSNLTTNNSVLLRVIKELKPIICEQGTAKPIVPKEDDLQIANKLSFGDDIGKVTNRGTSLYNVLAKFEKGTAEYNEIQYRIKCVQHYQQNAIDKTKGAEWSPFPKEWYSANANQIIEYDTEEDIQRKLLNISILADKQPYFFIYRYPETSKKYKEYVRKHEDNCIFNYGIKLQDMLTKQDRDKAEENFVFNYYSYIPVSLAPSTMNRICWKVEEEFKGIKKGSNKEKFDYTVMKSGIQYNQKHYKQLQKLYNKHNALMQSYKKISKQDDIDKEESNEQSRQFVDEFRNSSLEICSNMIELTDMVLDICYSKLNESKSKQFAWDICGEQIIRNLCQSNDFVINIPVLDENGDINFNGKRFRMTKSFIRSV
ncbi:hypothetical protein [Paenibacillus ferrarius]|uniref:hypothetical protein n=1 Tax=Paenibacillus ferrarius TaxID=1469647 RepID=UPI0009A4C339|nr:hypothetical protein [Paenibacillus ferrarius]